VLDVERASLENGAKVIQWDWHELEVQILSPQQIFTTGYKRFLA
jgi:hypothetical protein